MNKPELIYNLQVAFKTRVTSLCDNAGVLTEQEATELLGKTPIGCILQAFTSLSSWIKGCPKKPHRITIMRKLAVFIDRENNKAVTSGHAPKFPPKNAPQIVPVAAPIKAVPEPTKVINTTDELRELFQSNCTNAGDWCLSEQDVLQLLKSYSVNTLKKVFKELGRFDDNQQQECFDRLQELLDQSAWQMATEVPMQEAA